MAVRAHLSIGLGAALAACTPATTSPPLHGYAQPSCGPADGPAIEMVLTDAALPADPRAWLDSIVGLPIADVVRTDGGARLLRVFVWDTADRLVGRRIDLSGDGRFGDIQSCGPGGCRRVPGTLRVERAGAALGGRVEIGADPREIARFDARWIERTVLCG